MHVRNAFSNFAAVAYFILIQFVSVSARSVHVLRHRTSRKPRVRGEFGVGSKWTWGGKELDSLWEIIRVTYVQYVWNFYSDHFKLLLQHFKYLERKELSLREKWDATGKRSDSQLAEEATFGDCNLGPKTRYLKKSSRNFKSFEVDTFQVPADMKTKLSRKNRKLQTGTLISNLRKKVPLKIDFMNQRQGFWNNLKLQGLRGCGLEKSEEKKLDR